MGNNIIVILIMPPAIITQKTTDNYGYTTVSHYLGDDLHNEDGLPAVIKYDKNGTKFCETYYQFGKKRTYQYGPSTITYFPSGPTDTEQYIDEDNLIHHETEPAYRWFDQDGKCHKAQYYSHGKCLQ